MMKNLGIFSYDVSKYLSYSHKSEIIEYSQSETTVKTERYQEVLSSPGMTVQYTLG